MTRWAVLDLDDPDSSPIYVGRWRLYARYLAAWLPHTAVVPWSTEIGQDRV